VTDYINFALFQIYFVFWLVVTFVLVLTLNEEYYKADDLTTRPRTGIIQSVKRTNN